MRIIVVAAVAAALSGLGACQQTPAAAGPQMGAVEPDETMRETFVGCAWGKVEGATLSVWSYDCPPDRGDYRLVADDSLPGFAIVSKIDGQTSRQPVIIAFKKPAEAPISAVLAAVRARSPGPHTGQCELAQVTAEGVPDGVFTLEPTGATKVQWDAFVSGDETAPPMAAPCGDMGPQMSGDRMFRVLESDPTTVLYVDYGSEIQIFDASSVAVKPAA